MLVMTLSGMVKEQQQRVKDKEKLEHDKMFNASPSFG